MTKIQKIVASAVAGASLLVNTALPVFATTITITGNGADSENEGEELSLTQTTTITQDNHADIDNNIHVDATTGGNTAEKNTGGDVSIETGDAEVGVEVTNVANSNSADVACCGLGDVDVKISGNGYDSENEVEDLKISQSTTLLQTNTADVYNYVDADAKTGANEAEKNTGGSVEIKSGDATVGVKLATTANANYAVIGGGSPAGTLSAWIVDNGADTDNDIELGLVRTLNIFQTNNADIDNDVYADAKTGKNEAEKNTGGSTSIETGDALADVTIDNMANFNWADVDCGGCMLTDLFAKIAGNGYDSENEIEAMLADILGVYQTNLATSGELDNDVYVDAKTGANEVEKGTGSIDGDPSIESGDATGTVGIDNSVNFNSYGSEVPTWFPELPDFQVGFDWSLFLAWFYGAFGA
ncbi:MAG: hypothetical protein A2Z35_03415 [Actinobacteria bacterium RBG_19FT_COMBO_36_27]|nr:MAG: hypothetical protein A2Z35_03415 [Actinobacteria bacterium RBG_19FT_COMBO_36_27]